MATTRSVLRVARPTDNLVQIAQMYQKGFGFELLGEFYDHEGFDGIIGHPCHSYHLEFTHHRGTAVGRAPTQDNLLVFYIIDHEEWLSSCDRLVSAGFIQTTSYNPYWDRLGRTFEDLDGYRIVLQNSEWIEKV